MTEFQNIHFLPICSLYWKKKVIILSDKLEVEHRGIALVIEKIHLLYEEDNASAPILNFYDKFSHLFYMYQF